MSNKEKDLHDKRGALYTGSLPGKPDITTAYNCLNAMRKRTSASLGADNVGQLSFKHALDTAEGVEIFTVWEQDDAIEYRTIVKNLKDNWQQDTKYINAPLDSGFETGRTVTWKRLDNMRWLIVWQDFNYSGFFRGEIQRASHLLKWKDSNGVVQQQWAVIRGPVETKAKYDNVSGNFMGGRANDSLEILIGSRDDSVKDLTRLDKIRIGDRTWEIQVRDDISNKHVLRLSCVEDFNNVYTDDMINAIPDGLIEFPTVVVTPPPVEEILIIGKNTIKEGFSGTYTAKVDDTLILGDFKVYKGSSLISEVSGASSITFKGTKLGDKLTIEFHKDGELKTSVEVKVVSIFS